MTNDPSAPDPWDLLEKMLDAGGNEDIDLTAALEAAEDSESTPEAVDSARRFLELMVSGKALELSEGVAAKDLAAAFAPVLAEGDVEKVTEWLLDNEGVEDLFATDEDLEKILARW